MGAPCGDTGLPQGCICHLEAYTTHIAYWGKVCETNVPGAPWRIIWGHAGATQQQQSPLET